MAGGGILAQRKRNSTLTNFQNVLAEKEEELAQCYDRLREQEDQISAAMLDQDKNSVMQLKQVLRFVFFRLGPERPISFLFCFIGARKEVQGSGELEGKTRGSFGRNCESDCRIRRRTRSDRSRFESHIVGRTVAERDYYIDRRIAELQSRIRSLQFELKEERSIVEQEQKSRKQVTRVRAPSPRS